MTTIRKATSDDAKEIAHCLFLAMEDIVYEFIGEASPEKGEAFLTHFTAQEHNQYSYQNCWVAEVDTRVVAALNLYDGARLLALRQSVLDYIRARRNQHFTPEQETQAGEYYIDSLGVDPSQQGNGIGTQLLQFVLAEYVHKRHQTIGLLVDEENPGAKRLYLKLRFESVGSKKFLGKKMEHLQIRA